MGLTASGGGRVHSGKILKFAIAKIVAKSDTSACGLTVAQYICDRFAKISIYCCVGQYSVVFRDLEPFKWNCFRAHKIENDQSQLSTAIICVSMLDLVSQKRIFNTIIYKPLARCEDQAAAKTIIGGIYFIMKWKINFVRILILQLSCYKLSTLHLTAPYSRDSRD